MKENLPTAIRLNYKLLASLMLAELFLVTVYALDVFLEERYWLLHALFDLDGEGNIPTWFSASQLLIIGVLLWALAVYHNSTKRPSRAFFCLLGAGFVYLSMDEASQIHERVTQWIGQRYLDWLPGFLTSHTALTLVLLVVLALLLRAALRSLWAIWQWSRPVSLLALSGACLTIGGGIVLESIGYLIWHNEKTALGYKAEVAAEEFMEMLGVSLILCSVLSFTLNRTTRLSEG